MPDDLRIEYVALQELVHWPRNPKDHDLGALSQSLKRFGYISPIIVDEGTGRIVAGHGRVDLLLHLKNSGERLPDRVRQGANGEWLVPVIRGIQFRNEQEAEAYLVADNQLVVLGGWHDQDLYDVLKRHLEGNTLDGMGFTPDDVQELHERLMESSDLGGSDDEESAEPFTFDVFDKETIIALAFDFFRARGFPYRAIPLHTQMLEINRLSALRDDPRAVRSNLGILTADTYHPHRFECHATDKRSPVDSFGDDEQLQRALALSLDNGQMVGEGFFSMLTLVAGTQACSNFRPGVAMHYYRRFGREGGIVLDPCTGYGGRLVGWIASRIGGQYIGIDPSKQTHDANDHLAAALARSRGLIVDLFNQPFEDVDVSGLESQVDCIVTSPPYFAKELYAREATQSYQRYRTIDEWEEGFLRPLLRSCALVLAPERALCLNIADVKLRNRTFPLEDMTRRAAVDAGLDHGATERIEFSSHYGKGQQTQGDEPKTEPMFIFAKPRDPRPVVVAQTVHAAQSGHIAAAQSDAMFEQAGVDKTRLYTALRTMGREQIKGAELQAQWSPENPTRNYCYVISEFVYRYVAPQGSTVWRLDVPGDSAQHWFVRWPDGALVDLAAEQFDDYETRVRYDRAQRATFRPNVSQRAKTLARLCGFGDDNA